MIDTHAHILNQYYNDIDDLIKLLKNNNVICVLNAASNYKESLEIIELSKLYPNYLLSVIGIHPESVNEIEMIDKIEKLIKENKVYAIGEIGLDYYWIKDNKEKQKELFIKQLELANKYDLPVVIHSRDAIKDTYDILKKYKVRGVLHAFSGSVEMAREFIKLGYKIGVGGVLTFKNSKLFEVIKNIDLNSIMLETDSPYLTPEPFRGKQNNPSNVYYVAKKIAEIKNISVEEVIKTTTKTAISFFDI